jgi:hypothetical protein
VPISDNVMRLLRDMDGELPTSLCAHPNRMYNLEMFVRVAQATQQQGPGWGPCDCLPSPNAL